MTQRSTGSVLILQVFNAQSPVASLEEIVYQVIASDFLFMSNLKWSDSPTRSDTMQLMVPPQGDKYSEEDLQNGKSCCCENWLLQLTTH